MDNKEYTHSSNNYMNHNKEFSQIKSLIVLFTITYLLLFGLFVSVAIISMHFDIPVGNFTRDPIAILRGNPFTGVISNIGILFWCSTAAICIFVSKSYPDRKEFSLFLLFSGLFTFILLLDDLFQLHEKVDTYFHVHEYTAYVVYFILISIYFVKFGKIILSTEYMVLFIACCFLSLSVLADMLLSYFITQRDIKFLIEDGFKLFGIVTWFIYFIRTSFFYMQEIKNQS